MELRSLLVIFPLAAMSLFAMHDTGNATEPGVTSAVFGCWKKHTLDPGPDGLVYSEFCFSDGEQAWGFFFGGDEALGGLEGWEVPLSYRLEGDRIMWWVPSSYGGDPEDRASCRVVSIGNEALILDDCDAAGTYWRICKEPVFREDAVDECADEE